MNKFISFTARSNFRDVALVTSKKKKKKTNRRIEISHGIYRIVSKVHPTTNKFLNDAVRLEQKNTSVFILTHTENKLTFDLRNNKVCKNKKKKYFEIQTV